MNKLVWMDSGAFSAKTLGAEISLRRYCQWLRRYKKFIDHYAVLDAIGNDRQSAQTTWDNQRRMEEEFDLAPVPCFHYGEPFEYLERYVMEYDYIALGGMVPIETNQLALWLDEVWRHYLSYDGAPIVKVHGFGMTTFSLMSRYPWFSVDSSSWLMGGRNGTALFMVNVAPTALGCSAKSAGPGTLAGLGPVQRASMLEQAEVALRGFLKNQDVEDVLEASYIARNLLTLHTFEEWRKKWEVPHVDTDFEAGPTLFPLPTISEALGDKFYQFKLSVGRVTIDELTIFYAGCWPGGWKQLPPYPRMFSYHYIDQHGGKKAVNFNMVDEFNAVVKARGGEL